METQASTYNSSLTDTRGDFLRNTYTHVAVSLLAFLAIEYYLFSSGIAAKIAAPLANNWLLVIGGLVLVSFLVSMFGTKQYSRSVQYLVLGAYIVVQAIIFVPILAVAGMMGGESILTKAAYITVGMVAALSAVVFYFKQNFSFLGPFLAILGIAALALIVTSLIFGFDLGLLFTYAMITYAAGAILYETSNILHEYDNDDYVAAALGLLTSVMLLLWYVVQALLSQNR